MRISKLLVFFGCLVSCKTSHQKEFFKDKYLIYTKQDKFNDSSFYDAFFIANISDTIFEVDHAFGSRGRDGKSPPLSRYPYRIVNEKDGIHYIFIGFYNAWPNSSTEDVNVRRYPKKNMDTVKMDLSNGLTEQFSYSSFYWSYRLPRDTTIHLNGKRFNCGIYREQVPSSGGAIIYEKYVDKATSMPIVVNRFFYENGSLTSEFSSQRYILRFWLNKSEVKSNEFRRHTFTGN